MTAKPFLISKKLVFEAWKRIKANGGAHGVDEVSIEEFEENLSGNLYRIWNRMSSGSYFPPPVRHVDIPKDNRRDPATRHSDGRRSHCADGRQNGFRTGS